MNAQEMKRQFKHFFDGPGTFVEAEILLQGAVEEWFREFGEHLNPDKHFLQINPVRVHWSKIDTRIKRTADLILHASATSTPHAHANGKVLCKGAVEFSVSWPNAKT